MYIVEVYNERYEKKRKEKNEMRVYLIKYMRYMIVNIHLDQMRQQQGVQHYVQMHYLQH